MTRFDGKYLSLTSLRRDGTSVATPVWFVADDGHLLVETDADSYKVKRIRRDPHVRIALCDARGRLGSELVDAEARILPDDERERVEQLLARKYRIDRFTVYPVYRLVMRLRGRGSRTNEPPVALEITPSQPRAPARGTRGARAVPSLMLRRRPGPELAARGRPAGSSSPIRCRTRRRP